LSDKFLRIRKITENFTIMVYKYVQIKSIK